MATLTVAMAGLDPTVTEDTVAVLLAAVTPQPGTQARLAAQLAADPALLTRGGSRMTKLVGQFCYAAIEAGVAGVVSPGCARCGRPRTLFHPIEDGQRICPDCYYAQHTATCALCGRLRPVKARTDAGEPVCDRCQANTRQAPCDGCGRTAPVKQSTQDGRRYCRTCRSHRARAEVCAGCGRTRRVNARTPTGQALCVTCYARTRPPGVCDRCGRLAPLVVRAAGRATREAEVNLCGRCYTHPHRRCGICGRTRRVSLKATGTTPDVCPTCHQWTVVDCTVCGSHGPGRATAQHGRPICFRCQATARIDAALTGPDGTIPQVLRPVRDAITSQARPLSILANLTRTTSLILLGDLAAGRRPITHDALDDADTDPLTGRPSFAVTYLRSLLTATGALPPRDENLARLRRYTHALLATIPDPEQRALLTRYARWQVIGRARPDRHATVRAAVAHRCRDDIRTAVAFLEHLSAHGQDVDTCTQPTLDAWLAGHPHRAGGRTFLRWLRRDRHLRGVDIPPAPPRSTPRRAADDEHRWDLARRLLHDPTSASVEDRVAALLVLLYAQQITTIAQLTVDDLTTRAGGTYLRLGPEPLLLLPPLDALITSVPETKAYGAASVLTNPKWLFPGKAAGGHVHPATLMRRLNTLGITARHQRNAALLHLAAATPAAVFASLIGISIGTAVRWSDLAGGNWTNYATARAGRSKSE